MVYFEFKQICNDEIQVLLNLKAFIFFLIILLIQIKTPYHLISTLSVLILIGY